MDPYPLFESVSKGIYCSNCMELHGKEIKESPEETTTVSQHAVLFFYVSGCTECNCAKKAFKSYWFSNQSPAKCPLQQRSRKQLVYRLMSHVSASTASKWSTVTVADMSTHHLDIMHF